MGAAVKKCAMQLPYIEATESIQPITRTILRINLELFPEFEYVIQIFMLHSTAMLVYAFIVYCIFRWNDRFHGKMSVAFWIWIEDPESDLIYHWEQFLITKKQVKMIILFCNLFFYDFKILGYKKRKTKVGIYNTFS